MSIFKNLFKSFKNLTEYRYSSGGDMIGSSHSQEITPMDNRYAIITLATSNGWWQPSSVTEYQVDRKILSDIENLFRRYRIKSWNESAMRLLFVADGASSSYTFVFGKETVSFSSQCFPAQYAKKLANIDALIRKYMENATRLPGYQTPLLSPQESQAIESPADGLIRLLILKYSKKHIQFRVLNGTDAAISLPMHFVASDVRSHSTLGEKTINYQFTVEPHSYCDHSLLVSRYLEEGTYRLTVEPYSVDFEIR